MERGADGAAMIVLLRAVNLGSRNRVPMGSLRAVAEGLGHRRVSSHLQSGNLVLLSSEPDPALVALGMRRGMADSGLPEVAVLVRTACELASLLEGNPLPPPPAAGGGWHVTFLERLPPPERARELDPLHGAPDSYRLVGREVYVRCTAGYSDSALGNSYFERRLGVAATTRNWATLLRLAEMGRVASLRQPPETAGMT